VDALDFKCKMIYSETLKTDQTRPSPMGPAPALEMDTEYLLGELLGISDHEIVRLREEGVVLPFSRR
jgi:crotonobetainyl-CoA:carnitine CoA-transferase CaiB-like acyl-CoA transferase